MKRFFCIFFSALIKFINNFEMLLGGAHSSYSEAIAAAQNKFEVTEKAISKTDDVPVEKSTDSLQHNTFYDDYFS